MTTKGASEGAREESEESEGPVALRLWRVVGGVRRGPTTYRNWQGSLEAAQRRYRGMSIELLYRSRPTTTVDVPAPCPMCAERDVDHDRLRESRGRDHAWRRSIQ